MQKNQKGVTIMALVITILLLIMLTAVSLNTGYSVLKDIRVGRIISHMVLVKAKAETIYEQHQFNREELIGTPTQIDFLSEEEKGKILEKTEKGNFEQLTWYQWDANTLISQGLDANLLGNDEYFYVNYEFAEIVYSQGTSFDSQTYYSLTGLNQMYENS